MALIETRTTGLTHRGRALAAPLLAAAAALLLNRLVPVISALLLALAVGAVLANVRRDETPARARQAQAARAMLRVGVVLLGLSLPWQHIAAIGVRGVLVIAATVTATYAGTQLIGRRLGLDRDIVTLVASGFSICGAAAIAAVSDVTRARQRDVALAVAMVTVFGGVMIGLLPALGHLVGLGTTRTAIWAGASIHEVAQVAAAASLVGTPAVALAMLVKLGRVSMLAPLCWVIGRSQGEQRHGRAVPWFIVGFAALSALRSLLPLPASLLDVGSWLTTLALAAGMFGLGLGLRLRDLWPIPGRVLLLATCSTAIAAGISFSVILLAY